MASNLSPTQQRELQAQLESEQQRYQVQEVISKITSACFDRCVGTPGGRLANSEEACLTNCAKRYLDVTRMAVDKLSHR